MAGGFRSRIYVVQLAGFDTQALLSSTCTKAKLGPNRLPVLPRIETSESASADFRPQNRISIRGLFS